MSTTESKGMCPCLPQAKRAKRSHPMDEEFPDRVENIDEEEALLLSFHHSNVVEGEEARKMEGTSQRTPYQIFLSFRGPDTRQGFADTLYHALNDAGIHVFRDSDEIRKGKKIFDEILTAVKESKIFVPIFSKRYASSKWCLIDLAKMWESMKSSSGKRLIPIFYDVDVCDVKLRAELYKGALKEHKSTFRCPHAVQQWENALQAAGGFSGYEVLKTGHGEFAKSFVKDVSKELKVKHKPVPEHLVQRDDLMENLMKLVDIESHDVRFVVIHGMGGIGKTTLAKVVFNKLCDDFDHCSFLPGVSESSQQPMGLVNLQKNLLASLGLGSWEVMDKDDGTTTMKRMLARKQVLIVLDDIDRPEQIQCLAGGANWFGSGSRIIITTQDQQVLQIKNIRVQTLKVKAMEWGQALQLFSRHAFGKDSPPEDRRSRSENVIASIGGLPLALEAIGLELSGENAEKKWDAASQKKDHRKVQNHLMKSYEALELEAQQIFLDIACFFIDHDKRYPKYLWEACHFFPQQTLKDLIQRSMVEIVVKDHKYKGKEKTLWMDDWLRELGRTIVRGPRPDNSKRSRLWWHKSNRDFNVEDVLNEIEKDENVEMIRLIKNGDDFDEELRCLESAGVIFSKGRCNLGSKLTWLSWPCSCETFNATNLWLRNLVILDLSDNPFVSEDWRGWSQLAAENKLKILDLTGCSNLTKTPNFRYYSSLERLILARCLKLVEIDDSIGKLRDLKFLNVEGCDSLNHISEKLWSLDNVVIRGDVNRLNSSNQRYMAPCS